MSESHTHKREPVGKLYAKALFELAKEKNELDTVQQSLSDAVELLHANPELSRALSAFMFSVEERAKLAAEVGKKAELNPLVLRLVNLLISKNRIQLMDSVYAGFRRLADEGKGVLRGSVTAAEKLTDAEAKEIATAFGRKFNKNVVLDPVVDKEILGGLVVKVHGRTYDGSLKTTIRRLKETLERQSI